MRPRVFPAEDSTNRTCAVRAIENGFNEAAGIPRGRRRTATTTRGSGSRFNEAAGILRGRQEVAREAEQRAEAASMRPRVFPSEDIHGGRHRFPADRASMRPRVFPAEDFSTRTVVVSAARCFNEAAGIPRGRLQRPLPDVRSDYALQ